MITSTMHLNTPHKVNVLPHIYVIIQWHNAGLRVEVGRPDRTFYSQRRWKSLWAQHWCDSTVAVNRGHPSWKSPFKSVTSWVQSESPSSTPTAPTAPANSSSLPFRRSPGQTHTQSVWLIHSLHFSNSSYVQQTIHRRRDFCFWLYATINSWIW